MRQRSQHLIASVKYGHRTDPDDAPLLCRCGWSGLSRDFQPHRKEHGESGGSGHGYATASGENYSWPAQYRKGPLK